MTGRPVPKAPNPYGNPTNAPIVRPQAKGLTARRCDGTDRALGNEVWRTRLPVLPIAALIVLLVVESLTMHLWRPRGAVHDVAFGIASILHYAAAVTVILVVLGAPVQFGVLHHQLATPG